MRMILLAGLASMFASRSSWAQSPGTYTITAADKCLGVAGTRPITADCDDSADQRWKVTEANGGFFRIESSAGKCLDILNDGKQNNLANVAACANASGQMWKLRPAGGGAFVLTTSWRGDTKCLDTAGPQLADCVKVPSQRWTLTPVGRGSKTPVAREAEPAPRAAARDPHAMPVDPRSTFDPRFIVIFSECDLGLRDSDADFSEARSKSADVVCAQVSKQQLRCKLTAYTHKALGPSRYVFDATVTADTKKLWEFNAPTTSMGPIAVRATVGKDEGTLVVDRPDGRVTCTDGAYMNGQDFKTSIKKFLAEQAAKARREAEQEEREERAEPAREPARERAPERAPEPKGSAKGRMCGKDKDCQSGSCKMENKTRGRCE
jgi:hypothetical protein